MHVNDRAQLAAAEARAAAPHQPAVDARGRRRWSTRPRPTSTRRSSSSPTCGSCPGTILEGRTVVSAGSVIGPDTRLVDTIVGERAVVRKTVARRGRDRRRVHRRPVRLAAAGHPPRRRRARRHVRRDQERRDRRGREGAAPLLRRRRRDRRPGEHRRRARSPPTTTASDKHRTVVGADARIASNTVLVAPVEVGDGAYTGAGAVVNRDVPPGALAKGVPAQIEEGWAERRTAPTSCSDEEGD